ncbi:MAG TPA: UvrD-helicase domain-containing protein [Frankiaceae bacterium]|nr:UvrD-helicase domain-containing protein [Frankiaceae bacterium]
MDEYQDLTAAEQEMIELLWSGKGSLVVMGDNDLSIYSFRFNHPSAASTSFATGGPFASRTTSRCRTTTAAVGTQTQLVVCLSFG